MYRYTMFIYFLFIHLIYINLKNMFATVDTHHIEPELN